MFGTDRSRRNVDASGWLRTRAQLFAVLAIAAVVLSLAGGCNHVDARGSAAAPGGSTPAATATSATASAESSAGLVEVPNVVGLERDEASLVLQAAGLGVAASQALPGPVERWAVCSQSPPAGTLSGGGSVVRLAFSAGATPASAKVPDKRAARFVVCIDPGHQAHADTMLEPIGPGSKEMRPRASGGATGARTGIPEYEIALQLATNLADRLEAQGITVVMTRTTNDVDLPNSKRAAIANGAHADLFVRIHADSSTDPAANGVSTLYPAVNVWTKPIANESRRAALLVQQATVRSTKAADLGAVERSDLVGFNWARVPCVLVEAGFLSNSVEDRLLASPRYQDGLSQGIADGVVQYLQTKGR